MHASTSSQAKLPSVPTHKLAKLTLAGALAFWLVDFAVAVSPLQTAYLAAFSVSSLPLALMEALMGGTVIAFAVSFLLLRFSQKIPTRHPLTKALLLSFAAAVLIGALQTLGNPQNAYTYLLVDTAMNLPRITALGAVIGYLCCCINAEKQH